MGSKGMTPSEFEKYILDNLDRALEDEWIKAYHQPLVRAASRLVSDEEAFARWEDPEKGHFAAAQFIPILEKHNLTYKLDLYMVDRVLKKMKSQGEYGLFIVPESVNIGRSDFDCCDMVTEIVKRVDASGLPREKFSVELSERSISTDIEFMKSQIERFQSEGIKVWMDDYGNGYSSLLLLLKIHFHLLKIDKIFVDLIEQGEEGRIILTELVKTAQSLGMDTVAEGVETKEQAEFLSEIGCSKLQGYYFARPNSLAMILERNKKGIQIGFENPEEAPYFEQLGKVSLYDLSFSKDDDDSLNRYFDTLPMAIFSLNQDKAAFIRCNNSYREFVSLNYQNKKYMKNFDYSDIKPGIGYYTFKTVKQCALDGKRAIIDDRMFDGRNIQLFIRRIAVNPVTGAAAVAICILSVSSGSTEENLNYNYVARALSEDYIKLYFVDMETDKFTEYASYGDQRDISFESYGEDYFNLTRKEFSLDVVPEDKQQLINDFTKKKFEESINKNGTYSVVTRIVMDGKPVYVSFKGAKVRADGHHIIVGLSNVDDQIKSREALEKAKETELIYSRIGALSGDYIFLYSVNPKTLHYTKYNPTNAITEMGIPNEGDDFFNHIIKKAPDGVHPDDLDPFLSAFNQKNVMEQIRKIGFFEHHHRLNIDGSYIYVVIKAVLVQEDGEDNLIVGILNVDERVRKEQEFAQNLFEAESKASIDELTGIKNKNAYAETEARMDARIADGEEQPFAIAVFDLNGLKQVNDTLGHQAGDMYIKNGCAMICRHFKHSPVYRVGGDEFVAIVQGQDLTNLDAIMVKFRRHNLRNMAKGDVVIAVGASKYDGDENMASVFQRADDKMYFNKAELKEKERRKKEAAENVAVIEDRPKKSKK